MAEFKIVREIGIDAGHRIPDHGSKCRNLHGHRYTIQAMCVGELIEDGASSGMVLDFGFLKEEMMEVIDKPCDHGLILFKDDSVLSALRQGQIKGIVDGAMKIVEVDFIPTAENLAKYWYDQLKPRVAARSDFKAHLRSITVWETPNCAGVYPA